MAELGEGATAAVVAVPERRLPVPPAAAAAIAAARAYAQDALAPETRRAYAADWAHFASWCQETGGTPLPAASAAIAAYLAAQAPLYSRAALKRRLAAIGHAHRLRGLDWSAGQPAIRSTLRGIYRQHGSRRRQAAALTSVELRKLVAACPGDLAGLRDRALLLLPRSKTDPEGKGVELGLSRGKRRETCPVRAVEAWLEASACQYGPVFRKVDRWGNIEHTRLGSDAVRDILRRRAAAAKVTVPAGERLSPHGLRAGFVPAFIPGIC